MVRLTVSGDGSMSAQDFFSPTDAAQLDLNDQDLGSGGPVALPAGFGTPSHPRLLVQVGKDGRVFLLDRGDLGGRSQAAGGGDKVVGVTGPFNAAACAAVNSARRLTTNHLSTPHHLAGSAVVERTRMVPTFIVIRSTG